MKSHCFHILGLSLGIGYGSDETKFTGRINEIILEVK